jgi:hypothetical protein
MEELINHLNSALYLFEAVGCFWIAKTFFQGLKWICENFDIFYKGEDKKKDEH